MRDENTLNLYYLELCDTWTRLCQHGYLLMSEAIIECISPRTGIKSSLKEHVQAVVTSYILWVSNDKPYYFDYSEEFTVQNSNGDNKYQIKFSTTSIDSISNYLSEPSIAKKLSGNVLCNAHMEALQTGLLNIYKFAHITFVDEHPGSAERTGGNRYSKRIYFSSLVDSFHAVVTQNSNSFQTYANKVISGDDYTSDPFHNVFGEFWSPFVDITKFKDQNQTDMESLATAAAEKNYFHENGTARILKSYLSENLHPFIKIDTHTVTNSPNITRKTITQRNAHFKNYLKRSEILQNILKPNYCTEESEEQVKPEIKENSQEFSAIQNNKTIIRVIHHNIPKINDDLPLNLILSGVPGTGKSFLINEIIKDYFNINQYLEIEESIENILKINVHSETKNSSLMQGISVSLNQDGNVFYAEKQGAILNLILTAIQYPNIPFLVVLEEIQENSLNLLIGDLIYLIEPDKRVDLTQYTSIDFNSIWDLINTIILDTDSDYINLPALVSNDEKKKLILPNNVYFICTANHRDDRKIIEDNLLRRFHFLEVFPRYEVIKNAEVRDFLIQLNDRIANQFEHLESEHMLSGHASWMNIDNKTDFWRTFSKFLTDMRKIKQVDFSDIKNILTGLQLPFDIQFELNKYNNYHALFSFVQSNCKYQFMDS